MIQEMCLSFFFLRGGPVGPWQDYPRPNKAYPNEMRSTFVGEVFHYWAQDGFRLKLGNIPLGGPVGGELTSERLFISCDLDMRKHAEIFSF